MHRRRILLTIALAVAVLSPLTAAQPRALPSFELRAADGSVVPSAQLTDEKKWLLIYVGGNCRPCDRLLRSLKEWQTPELMRRTIVVIAGDPAAARAYVESQLPPELSGLRWFADPDGSAWRALALHGTPTLLGVQDGRIGWTLAGVLNEPSSVESVIRSWTER